MKIGILSMKGNFNKDLGRGTQKYIYNLWQNLCEIIHDKNMHTLKTKGINTSLVTIDKLELGCGDSRLARELSFTLASAIKNLSGYDIIGIPAPIAFNPFRRGKASVVTTIHELYLLNKDNPLINIPPQESYIATKIHGMCQKQALSSDYIIADSTLVEGEALMLGYDPKNIFMVNIGIDDEFIRTPLAPKGKTKDFIIGYLGSFEERKNAQFTINAVKQLTDNDIKYDIWGKQTGMYDKLVKLAVGDKRIAFKGFVPKEEMVKVYDSFDVYLHPILYTGFEMEILEAQARGIPVIIKKGAQIPEEVKRYCYEAKDEAHMAQIIKDIKDNGYQEQRRIAAINYARGFTWHKTAEETLKVYEKINGQ